MSKAVLVLDDMPLCCEECRFTDSGGDVCCLCNKDISEHEYGIQKPNWCPLRELPKRKDLTKTKSETEFATFTGWNLCMTAITGKMEE